jgi:CheY-like chemotaxis protein
MADDDKDDRLQVEGALEGLPVKLMCVENGVELMDYLYCRKKYYDTEKYPRPNLILLYLNMPKMGGREALEEIKTDPKLRLIPVVVFTTLQEVCDVAGCYQLGALIPIS